MHIAHIAVDIPLNRQSVLLVENVPKMESLVFERIMGLQNVARDPLLTYPKQLNIVFEKLLQESKIDSRAIKYVLFAHTADEIAPQSIAVLCDFIKYNKLTHSIYFGLSAHKCVSAFQGLLLSKLFFQGLSNQDHILLLISDVTFTPILQYIPGSTVLGDAACAILLKKEDKQHIVIDVLLKEVGQFSKDIYGNKIDQLRFQLDYTHYLCEVILAILSKNALDLSQITLIIPHNVNTLSWKKVANELNISLNKIYLDNIPKIGHCFGSDPFINLKTALSEGRLFPGDYYLLVTVGLGATFAVTLMKIVD